MPKLPNEIRNGNLCLDVSKQEVEAREVSEGVKITEELNPKPTVYQHRNPKYSTANSLISEDNETKKTLQFQSAIVEVIITSLLVIDLENQC